MVREWHSPNHFVYSLSIHFGVDAFPPYLLYSAEH